MTLLNDWNTIGLNHKESVMLVSSYQPPKTRPAARKYVIDENYFSSLDEARAYWLGYLSADGCVSVRTRNGTHQFVLSASSKDVEHLEKFRTALKSTYPIHGPYKGVYQFIATSYRLCLDLEEYGITPQKSLTLEPPDCIDTNNELFWEWLRGVIDGDGSFNRYWRPSRAIKNNGRGRPATAGRYVLSLGITGSYAMAENLFGTFGGSLQDRGGGTFRWSINDKRAESILRDAYAGSRPELRLDRKYELARVLGIVMEDKHAARTLEPPVARS